MATNIARAQEREHMRRAWGLGILESKMEPSGIMENQMEKNMDNEMETGIMYLFLETF